MLLNERSLVRFSREFVFFFDLKKWRYLKFSNGAKEKRLIHIYLFILWLPGVLTMNIYFVLFQATSLASMFFSAVFFFFFYSFKK